MAFRIGVDVGGTFTDFLLVSPDGATKAYKTLSTPRDPSIGVLDGMRAMAADHGRSPEAFAAEVALIVHGTTVATNAVLTGSGARVGLLTTRGFRDFLHMRRGIKERPFDNKMPYPKPLVERYLVRPVTERVDYAGRVVTPADESDAREQIELLRDEGVEAVAVCFLHAYANGDNEAAVAALVRELLPEAYLSVSSEVLPQIRLYDRVSTTTLNSYVGPIIRRYLDRLTGRLEEAGFGGVLLVMKSNGGVTSPENAQRAAMTTVLSGPASGPVAGAAYAATHGFRDCLTIDMGGTSFDVAMVKGGEPLVVNEGKVGPWKLALPMVDINAIGAGGGSIARVDNGILGVGPASAGADPGPACYGFGGELPTVTDADLVLGYLDADYFLGGEMKLRADLAEAAIERHVAQPLGLDLAEAAAGIYDVVNVNMAMGVREVTVRRGFDPRDFPLVVAGGAGPIHAGKIALELEIPIVIVPRESSIFCAAGMLMSDLKHDYVRTYKVALADADGAELAALYAEMAEEAASTLAREHVRRDDIDWHHAADMRYVGQNNELSIAFDPAALERGDLSPLAEEFHRRHDELFGYATHEMPLEFVNVRLGAVGRTTRPAVAALPLEGDDPEHARKGTRRLYLRGTGHVEAPVYDGHALRHGNRVSGPAIVEEAHTTVLVLPEFDLGCDSQGSFVMVLRERAGELGAALATSAAPAL